MYRFFIWSLYFMVLRRANPLLGALEGVGLGNFQGPPFPMPLVMDLARLKTFKYRAIYTVNNRHICNYYEYSTYLLLGYPLPVAL
jgi:hypothetical protein